MVMLTSLSSWAHVWDMRDVTMGAAIHPPLMISATQSPPKEVFYHAVERGETLSSIARKYNVSVNDILAVNSNLSKDKISVGMIILIPRRALEPNRSRDTKQESPVREESKPTKVQDTARTVTPQEVRQEQTVRGSVKDETPRRDVEPQRETPPPSTKGLRQYVVPSGQTVYNICKITGWSEEQLLYYNPQIKKGLQAGMAIFIPQDTVLGEVPPPVAHEEKKHSVTTPIIPIRPFIPTMPTLKIALVLPFSNDSGNRFSDYYEGFLLAVKETQEAGNSVDLYVYDCAPSALRATINEMDKLPSLDYIIGGVSDESIKQLAAVAELKGASYVIPFTSKGYKLPDVKNSYIFQINTPHDVMNKVAAERFVEEHRGEHVCIVRDTVTVHPKGEFVSTLKGYMDGNNITYEEMKVDGLMTKDDIRRLSQAHERTVMIPTSGSLRSATGVLSPIVHAMDSLGINNVTAFGYPEWQTYYALNQYMTKVNATFYTPFYVNTKTSAYKTFQRDFVTWFSHSIGNTYPKYSVLGYDTGKYFLFKKPEGPNRFGKAEEQGLQSHFDFVAESPTSRRFHNQGVIFVRHRPDGTVEGD